MIVGLKVIIPESKLGMNKKNQESEIVYLSEDGERVLLDTGYFYNLKDLVTAGNESNDPLLFMKCINKHGTILRALKYSMNK